MSFTLTQILLSIFLLFALSRVYLRFRGGDVSFFAFVFWTFVFGSAIVVVLFPSLSGKIAHLMGIGRGVDAIVYTSITILFYLVFRLYVYLEDVRHEITDLVQKLALRKENKDSEKKPAKD